MIQGYLPVPNAYIIEEDETIYLNGERYPTYHVHGRKAYLTIEMRDGEPYEITGHIHQDASYERAFATMDDALIWLAGQDEDVREINDRSLCRPEAGKYI